MSFDTHAWQLQPDGTYWYCCPNGCIHTTDHVGIVLTRDSLVESLWEPEFYETEEGKGFLKQFNRAIDSMTPFRDVVVLQVEMTLIAKVEDKLAKFSDDERLKATWNAINEICHVGMIKLGEKLSNDLGRVLGAELS